MLWRQLHIPLRLQKTIVDSIFLNLYAKKPPYAILTSLNVTGCGNLTDASIIAVAASCAALASLNVRSCRKLTDASIVAIATGCAALA